MTGNWSLIGWESSKTVFAMPSGVYTLSYLLGLSFWLDAVLGRVERRLFFMSFGCEDGNRILPYLSYPLCLADSSDFSGLPHNF